MEASGAGRPVYVPWADECRGRFAAFHGQMLESGRTRRWAAALEPPTLWQAAAVDDTARAAARVAGLLLRHAEGLGLGMDAADRMALNRAVETGGEALGTYRSST